MGCHIQKTGPSLEEGVLYIADEEGNIEMEAHFVTVHSTDDVPGP